MKPLRRFLNALFTIILHLIPWRLLEKFERKIQLELGKGWGSATTEAEAKILSEIAKQIIFGDLVVYDIGANVGDWTASIQRFLPDSRVVAFEPSKEAFDRLTRRFETSTCVTSVNLALGKENTETFLYADTSASGLGSLTKRRVKHFGLSFEHKELIKVITLDDWVENQVPNLVPNIIKMDVEGHELDVLMGASKCLNRIQIVQFEFGGGNIDTKTYFQDFWYFFESNGFEIKRLTPRGPKTVSQYSEAFETFMPTNYLAVHRQS